jgi:hypothetical protein
MKNLEIVVTHGNWQIPGRPPRWNWQVRRKEPSKFLVKGVTMGAKQDAHDAAAKYARRQMSIR